MKRRDFLKIAGGLGAAAVAGRVFGAESRPMPHRRNRTKRFTYRPILYPEGVDERARVMTRKGLDAPVVACPFRDGMSFTDCATRCIAHERLEKARGGFAPVYAGVICGYRGPKRFPRGQ